MKWEHLLEWQKLIERQATAKSPATTSLRGEFRQAVPLRMDIDKIQLRYNHRGELTISDAKATGFLVETKA